MKVVWSGPMEAVVSFETGLEQIVWAEMEKMDIEQIIKWKRFLNNFKD